MPEMELLRDPVLAAAYHRGWEARIVELRRLLTPIAQRSNWSPTETRQPEPRRPKPRQMANSLQLSWGGPVGIAFVTQGHRCLSSTAVSPRRGQPKPSRSPKSSGSRGSS